MGILCNKQRLIDITITPFGKSLFGRGIFRPRYFSLYDKEVIYNSSSFDMSIEQLPVFEAFSDIGLFDNSLYTESGFNSNLIKLSTDILTGSMSIIRTTDDKFVDDPVISRYSDVHSLPVNGIATTTASFISLVPRMESLKKRGNVIDQNKNVSITRTFTKNRPNYLISVQLSSSNGDHVQLFSSGSSGSWGMSDDYSNIYNKSPEFVTADSYFEVLKIT